jgi:hypothetical protein
MRNVRLRNPDDTRGTMIVFVCGQMTPVRQRRRSSAMNIASLPWRCGQHWAKRGSAAAKPDTSDRIPRASSISMPPRDPVAEDRRLTSVCAGEAAFLLVAMRSR